MTAGVTQEELNAYLDGELDPGRREVVEGYLARFPEEAARLASYRRGDQALKHVLTELAGQRIPAHLAETVRAGASHGRRRLAAAMAALLLLLAGATGWWIHARTSEPSPYLAELVRDAVTAYRTYAAEERHPAEIGAESREHLVARLSARVGKAIWLPDFAAFGYRLVGGRLLPSERGPAAQLAYEDAAGRRITCYFAAYPAPKETGLRHAEHDGVTTLYRVDDGLAYAVSGDIAYQQLRAIAETAYRPIEEEHAGDR